MTSRVTASLGAARNPDYLSVGDAGPGPLSMMCQTYGHRRDLGIAARTAQAPSTTDRGMQPQMGNVNTEPSSVHSALTGNRLPVSGIYFFG